jgi:hypothetical protein
MSRWRLNEAQGRMTPPSLIIVEWHEHLPSELQLRGADPLSHPPYFIQWITSGRPHNYTTWRSLLLAHQQSRFSLGLCASEALLGLNVRMNSMSHEPLNWLSTQVLPVRHCLAGGHATLLASGPTFKGEILCFLGLRAPSNKVSPLELLGRWCGTVYICKSPSNWEPQEEGMMSTAARFFPQ